MYGKSHFLAYSLCLVSSFD